MAKISLIRFLHRELGFNVIAFESELGDCTIGDFFSSEYSAEEFMRGSIGKVWHNRFILELFRELKESEGLHLTGIDVQQSRRKHFSSFLERYLTGRIRQQYIDFDRLANELLDKNGIFKWRFRKTVEETAKMGKELIEGLEKQTFPSVMLHKVVMQTIENRLNYVKANFQKSFSKLFEYRDELMAKNLEFLSTHIYPGDKFVIWAHNLHIKKQSSANRLSRYRSYAENLPPLMKEKSFVIGLYAKEGRMGDYSGRDYPIKKMSHKHMEWLLSHSPYQNSFVRCSHEWGQKKEAACAHRLSRHGNKTGFYSSKTCIR
ncbi:erythromycin esterase family protein [Bacillus glycinifermentans]|uniref:erythromycin esterase family protein n=1 Tax=Bacillus glycinifermentans TaxID=1664069 RepID=UPI002DB7F9E6|nr:erythromycin esterase family protein [Bacillus glycinifermentans]MEC3609291.1 erythromycin esterase family protein [Bacillus glycinifermentans]